MQPLEPNLRNSKAMDRRSFLKLSGLVGLGAAAAGMIPIPSEAVRFDRNRFKISKSRIAMGTIVSMTLISDSRALAEEAMGAAFEEMDRLTALLSRFDRRTAVAMLNAEGVLRDIPPEVSGVVDRALYFNRMTGGAFDMTVQPVVDLFRERVGKEKSIPTDDEIRKALCLVDSGMIEKQGRTLRFKRPGMGITLDGIAKGFIVDRASTVLARKGITDHLINAGGDIRSMGAHPDKTPWSIGIEDPGKKGNYPDVIRMKNGAVATSGNYEVYFDHEKMFHHIVDPKTGLSPELSTSVSVRAATAMDADALATSVFVMRPGKGTAFINSLAGCECLTITRRGTKRKSSGWGNQAI